MISYYLIIMNWTIQYKIPLNRLKGTTNVKFKYKIFNSKNNKTILVINWKDGPLIIYDELYDDEISKYNWSYNIKTCYAYTHNKFPSENDNNTLTMHKLIMNLANKEKQLNESIDHINQIKTHNVIENLRFVTQSIQNNNRQTRCDRVAPPQELINLGINELPRYIRYDYNENKFVIERNHPGINKIGGKFNSSGTKSTKVSTIYKYYDILKKITILNNTLLTQEELDLKEKKKDLYNEYCEIYKLITNETYSNIDYEYNYDYTCLEKHLSIEDKLYDSGGIPECSIIDINMLPKYCCYIKETKTRGECLYISRHHPNLKNSGLNDIKTTSNKRVSLHDKYNIMLSKLKIINENTGESLKDLLLVNVT
jgi:hypothetical protein